MFTKL